MTENEKTSVVSIEDGCTLHATWEVVESPQFVEDPSGKKMPESKIKTEIHEMHALAKNFPFEVDMETFLLGYWGAGRNGKNLVVFEKPQRAYLGRRSWYVMTIAGGVVVKPRLDRGQAWVTLACKSASHGIV